MIRGASVFVLFERPPTRKPWTLYGGGPQAGSWKTVIRRPRTDPLPRAPKETDIPPEDKTETLPAYRKSLRALSNHPRVSRRRNGSGCI